MAQIRFRINYVTTWGECLWLDYGAYGKDVKQLPLVTTDGSMWTAEIEWGGADIITYAYSVRNADGCIVRAERPATRHFFVGHRSWVLLCDNWTERGIDSVFLHSAFTECVFRHSGIDDLGMQLSSSSYFLLMRATPPPSGFRWGVLGSSPRLGEWQEEKVRNLVRTDVYEWCLPLASEDFAEGVYYKYVLVDENIPSRNIVWEEGGNRYLSPCCLRKGEAAVVSDDAPRMSLALWRGAGVVIPVFSLRSKGSQGIGDFGDLRQFINWAASTGMSTVQLLPVNDTTSSGTWRDSYPYSGISVFALHPIYLDLREWQSSPIYARYAERFTALNALPELDYEAVFEEKMAFLGDLYKMVRPEIDKLAAYNEFCTEHSYWLEPYARFCVKKARAMNFKCNGDEKFYSFVQYLLHNQMAAVHKAARLQRVILKGDIPIGICHDSVPAMVDSHLFHFNGQAGAPPDAFAVHGQNWGFPTYNWEEMSKDDYAWWRRRLNHMNNYFDAYRIDHVLGFFRIWEIPAEQMYGLLGHFRPALPLSVEEIRYNGFEADVARYIQPFVTTDRLAQLEEVSGSGLRCFFVPRADGTFVLKTEYDTQHKIKIAVPEGYLRDILMDVVAEVLFVNDPDIPGHYHPRIAAQQTEVFKTLTLTDQQAFNRLHDNFFYVRHNEFWAENALEKLPVIVNGLTGKEEHSMLPCAEDLGMVPSSVKGVLEKLNILSLEIQRMPKKYGIRFGYLQDNPYLSVTTIATHDMAPLRLWWRENEEQTQAFWHEVLGREGRAPAEATTDVCEQVVAMHFDSPSMFCLLALQDLLALDERLRSHNPEREQINVPANPNQYWQYRMHLTIEELVAATSFNEKLRALIAKSGRRR